MTSHAAAFSQKASLLQGKFVGKGTAFCHGKEVSYVEECTFRVRRKTPTMIVYRVDQHTRHGSKTMHLEMGVLKIFNHNEHDSEENNLYQAEAGYSHPLSSKATNELAKGTLDMATGTLTLESTGFSQRVATTDSAGDKHVTGLNRVYRRDGNCLWYDQYLSVNGGDLIRHLHCKLELQELEQT